MRSSKERSYLIQEIELRQGLTADGRDDDNCEIVDVSVNHGFDYGPTSLQLVAPDGGSDVVLAGRETDKFEPPIAADDDRLTVPGTISGNDDPHPFGNGCAVAERDLPADPMTG